MGGKYIKLKEASTYTPYSQEYISLLARTGRIEAKKFGRNWRVKREEVERYYAAHKEDIVKFGKLSKKSEPQKNRATTLRDLKIASGFRALGTRLRNNLAKPVPASIIWAALLLISGYVLAYSSLPAHSSFAVRQAGLPIVDSIVSTYKDLDRKVAEFFGDKYIEIVEIVIPGYTLEQPREVIQSSSVSEELPEDKPSPYQGDGDGTVGEEILSADSQTSTTTTSATTTDVEGRIPPGGTTLTTTTTGSWIVL